eukprot:306657_1
MPLTTFLVILLTMIHPLLHVHQQQAHIEQFALTAHQILQDASNIIQYHVGDKEDTISRLYQLQIAVDAHQFSDAEFTNNLLNGLDDLVYAVASVVGVEENVNIDSFWDPAIDDLLQHEQEIRESVQPVRTGANGSGAYGSDSGAYGNISTYNNTQQHGT